MSRHTPAISVVMPAYNCASFIVEAIESIQNQTFLDWELIVIDDGSTDATLEIARKYASSDKRLVILSFESNQGIVSALNRGIQEAKGEFIARMDSDDISLPARFETQINFLQDNPNICAVGSAVEIFYDRTHVGDESSTSSTSTSTSTSMPTTSTTCKSESNQNRRIQHPTSPSMVLWSMHFFCSLAHPSVMIRAAAAKSNPYQELQISAETCHNDFRSASSSHCEDYQLWLQLLRKGLQLSNVPDVLVHLRKHSKNVSSLPSPTSQPPLGNDIKTSDHLLSSPEIVLREHLGRFLFNPGDSEAKTVLPSWKVLQGVKSPARIENSEQCVESFNYLLCLEAGVIKMLEDFNYGTAGENVRADCTARLGELALKAMQSFSKSPKTSMLWQTWVRRGHSANLLQSLFRSVK